jgi:hypothetical protein
MAINIYKDSDMNFSIHEDRSVMSLQIRTGLEEYKKMQRPQYEYHRREHFLIKPMFTHILCNEECSIRRIYLILLHVIYIIT